MLSSAKYVKENIDKGNPQVLIDLRPAEDVKKGHIKGAVAFSPEALGAAKGKFPEDKKAPVILYGTDTSSAVSAFKTVRGWGYANSSVLSGGIESWSKAENPLVTGEPATAIVYVPKMKAGEISVEEFRKIADTSPPDKFILDVRDRDEAAGGMLKGAALIPAKEVSARLAEIPKDREIIIHCTVGARSEAAYNVLTDAGYKARYLDATIEIGKDGLYRISKD